MLIPDWIFVKWYRFTGRNIRTKLSSNQSYGFDWFLLRRINCVCTINKPFAGFSHILKLRNGKIDTITGGDMRQR